MPTVNPSSTPMPRGVLGWDGSNFYVLRVDATGHLQVDILSSALPAGAATLAEQQTQTTALQLIDDLRNALTSVGTDELDVNVESSALPTGAATLAEQQTQTATLELIALIRNALQSVDTDRLIVRGEDQLFSIANVVAESQQGTVSGANGYYDSDAVPAGRYWVITNIVARDRTNAITRIRLDFRHDGSNYTFHEETIALDAERWYSWHGTLYLDPGDQVRVTFTGSVGGDTCHIILTGYAMTLET